MSSEKGESHLSNILKRLEKLTLTDGADLAEPEQTTAKTASRAERPEKPSPEKSGPEKTGIDLEPASWPIGGELPFVAKSSSRLYSWRADRQLQDAIAKVALYLQVQRDLYYSKGQPLSSDWKNTFAGFYPDTLLSRVRTVQLQGRRVSNPWFYQAAKSKGITDLPDMAHRAVVTFLDVVVFNEKMTARHLFHGLVHTAQVKLLGAERYAELFVTGFLQARSYFLVPLKAHAFALDTRYAEDPGKPFSVESEVLRWTAEGRY